MTPRLLAAGLLCTLLLQAASVASVRAQESGTAACFGDISRLMDREQRLYRSVLFGQKAAADLPVGATRVDREFHVWMKTGGTAWRSLAEGYAGTTWSNLLMDERADVPVRRGLLEQRQTPTSDLLPPLLQSVRALQCRLRAVCALSRLPAPDDAAVPVVVEVPGCVPQSFTPLRSCTPATVVDLSFGDCDAAAVSVVEREMQLLRLLVAYDAAHRSLLQFAGGFEGFLADVRLPLLQPLWQAVRVLGSLDGLPCFLSQCDE